MRPGTLVWFVHCTYPEAPRVLILKKYERKNEWWQAIDPATGDSHSRVFPREIKPLTPTEVYKYVKVDG